MVPPPASCTRQVTTVLLVPVTVAVNCRCPPVVTEAVGGDTDTVTRDTVTVAVAVWVVSAWLVAITWKVPATLGAVYSPAAVTVPPPASCTRQVTAVLTAPVTG